jgi:hypothetical protein
VLAADVSKLSTNTIGYRYTTMVVANLDRF